MSTPRDNRGFTLVDLMVAVGAAAIVVVGVSLALGSIAVQSATAYTDQISKDDAQVALDLLRWDIEHCGTAIPVDLPVQSFADLADPTVAATMTWIARHTLRTLDNPAASNGRDQVLLGGGGGDMSATGAKFSTLLDNAVGNSLLIPKADAPGVAESIGGNPANASYLDPWGKAQGNNSPVDYVSVVDMDGGWRSAAPVRIESVDDNGHGVLRLTLDPAVLWTSAPSAGDWLFFHRRMVVNNVLTAPTRNIAQTRWYWEQDTGDVGTLYREVILDPDSGDPNPDAATAADRVTVLRNVVDFQLAYLVWRCGGTEPVWVDDLVNVPDGSGEFEGASYSSTPGAVGAADRFMAMRERVVAIRVGLLLRQPRPDANDQPWLRVGANDFELENHATSGLDLDYRYVTAQQVFDPINLRVKTRATGFEPFPPVRDEATDFRMTSGGQCFGRAVTSS